MRSCEGDSTYRLGPRAALDPAAVAEAYARVRDQIANDPLFAQDAASFRVSIERLDAMIENTPTSIAGEALYVWLDGADQFRWAAIWILREAMPSGTVTRLAGQMTLPPGTTALMTGDLVVDGDLPTQEDLATAFAAKLLAISQPT